MLKKLKKRGISFPVLLSIIIALILGIFVLIVTGNMKKIFMPE